MPATTLTLGPSNGSIKVRTYREGMASRAGHDLVLEVTRWNATADVDRDNPASSRVTAKLDLTSMEVREATGGVKPLSDGDRKDIAKNMTKTLSLDRFPEATFSSTHIEPAGEGRLRINGDLSLAGASRPVTLDLSVAQNNGTDRLTGSLSVLHTTFGVKPYSGLLGALKIKDEVQIDADVQVPRN